jgi:tetratricopeptide (TPR) repeat protein
MFIRCWHRAVVLVSGATLVFAWGCASAPRAPRPAAASEASAPDVPVLTEAEAGRLAEAHARFAAGVIQELNADPDAALQEYVQAAWEDPSNEGLVLDVSRRLLQKRETDKALELLLRATRQPKATGPMFARLGVAYHQQGKTSEAIRAQRQAIQRAPDSLDGYHGLFFTLMETKRETEALATLDAAAKRPTRDPEFQLGLAELYQSYAVQVPAGKEKARAGGLAVVDRIDQTDPTLSPILKLKLAETFASLEASEKAAAAYLDLLKNLEDQPYIREQVHARLAEIFMRGGNPGRAMEQLQAILHDDPANAQAYFLLGTLAYEQKKLEQAAEFFGKTIQLRPVFEPAYYELASVQIDLKSSASALATLERARARFQPNFALEFLTGAALGQQKAWSQALKHYTAAEIIGESAEPKRLGPAFYFQYGAACERSGDIAGAEKHFKKCLELNPDFTDAQNYLGYMWAERGEKLEQARELIEKAVKAEPKSAAFLDSLGWVLFKLNKPQEALGHIRRALELSSEPDPTLYDHLGDIYLVLKEPEKAREAWQKSLELEQNETIRKKLDASR